MIELGCSLVSFRTLAAELQKKRFWRPTPRKRLSTQRLHLCVHCWRRNASLRLVGPLPELLGCRRLRLKMEARTLAKAKTLPPPPNDWLDWGVILHRRLQCADEAADACELLAHVLWYHPPNHDDRERLAQLRVAEAVLALGNAFATDAADAALVGELRYGFVRPESDLVIVWAAKSDAITIRSRALQAYDRFVLFRGIINDLIDLEGAAALASKRRARRKKGEAFEEAGDDPIESVRAALQDHLEIPQTEGFAPFADAPRPGDASLKTEARKEIERLAAVVKSVDGVAACLVLVNGFAAARTLPVN